MGSMFHSRTRTLNIGDPAPDFRLRTVADRFHSRDDLAGYVALIVFFRGTW